MSSFICQECNKPIVDTPQGYVTECEHWPLPLPAWRREDAPRATEARIDRGDAVNLAMDWLENRPTLTPKGIQALCNAVMLMDKTLSSRPAIIEECARVCDEQYEKHKHYFSVGPGLATACATAIRALAPGGQNAALPSGEFTNRKPEAHGEGPAVAAPCGPGHDLPCWSIDPPAPVEVAEGAGEDLRKLALNLPVFDKNRNQFTVAMMQVAMEQAANCITDLLALRAAPSLSREEWRMVLNAIDALYCGPTTSPSVEALRAKVREAEK
jgi:hypothetical protein